MSHNLVKILTNEDGDQELGYWHYPVSFDWSNRCLCSGQVFGEGEGSATFETKIVQRGGITCPKCLSIIKSFKKVKL
jgi:hypothetical protein